MTDITTPIQQPVSVESEQALIGSVLRGGRVAFEKVKDFIRDDMFWSTSHKSVWKALQRIYNNDLQIDVIVLGDEMERLQAMGQLEQELGNGVWSGRAYLSELRASGNPRHIETYAEQVQDYHIKRFLLNYSSKIAYHSSNGRRGRDIISDIESELSKITVFSARDEHTVSIKDAVSLAYDWTEKAARGELLGVPTGFIDLDKILGTLIAGNVYLVAGRPGTGKTALCLTIANHAAQNKKRVGIFSLEMLREQVAMRLISQVAEVDLQSIIQGSLREGDWSKYTHGVEVVADLPITINDLSSINIAQIRHTARKMKANGGLDLLIVDYLQLATGTGQADKRYQEVGEISRGLKHLAGELNVPVLAAAQLSRSVEQRQSNKPVLSDLRESGDLEQDAYGVIFIYKSNDEMKQNILCVDVAKHRNGPVGACELLFRSSIVKFENASTKMFRPNDYTNI